MDLFEKVNMYDLTFRADGSWGIRMPNWIYEMARNEPTCQYLQHNALLAYFALANEPVPLDVVEHWFQDEALREKYGV